MSSLPRPAFINSVKSKEQQVQAQEQVKTEDISKVEQYIVVVKECLNVIAGATGRMLNRSCGVGSNSAQLVQHNRNLETFHG
jgi:hypothetical protein